MGEKNITKNAALSSLADAADVCELIFKRSSWRAGAPFEV